MRVGIFTYGMESHLTGIGRYTVELLSALRESEPEFEIVLLNPYPHSELNLYRQYKQVAVPELAKLPWVLARGPSVLASVGRRIDLDVLHDPCGVAPFPLRGHDAWARVVTVHDAVPYLFPDMQPLLTNICFQTRVRWSRFTADAVLTVSACSKSDLVQAIGIEPDRVHVSPLGVHRPTQEELQRWRAGPGAFGQLAGSVPYFLFVGSINARKNVSRLLSALVAVRMRGSECRLLFVGPTPNLDQGVMQQARALGDSVRWIGYATEEQLHILYARAAAVVYPSLYEGFGLPVLEAMAHGTPVISSITSSIPEVAGGAALLVDPTDETAIAEAMRAVLNDPAAAVRFATLGYERASRFSWANTASATAAAYRAAIRKRGCDRDRRGRYTAPVRA